MATPRRYLNMSDDKLLEGYEEITALVGDASGSQLQVLQTVREIIHREIRARLQGSDTLDEMPTPAEDEAERVYDVGVPGKLGVRDINNSEEWPTAVCLPDDDEDADPIARAMLHAAQDALEHTLDQTLKEYLIFWRAKHHDYGPGNHAAWQEKGCIIRACDKLLRLKRAYFEGVELQNESNVDSLLDLIGYGLIGLVCARHQWPYESIESIMSRMEKDTLGMEPLRCPKCGSIHTRLYKANKWPDAEVSYRDCGMECDACGFAVEGVIREQVGETLEMAIARICHEQWPASYE